MSVLLALVVLLAGCASVASRPETGPRPGDPGVRVLTFPRPKTLDAILALPDEKIDLAFAALVAERPLDPETDPAAAIRVVDRLAEGAAPRVRSAPTMEAKAAALSRYFFQEAGFRWASRGTGSREKGAPRGFALSLSSRLGNCYQLTLLFLAVAHRLDVPAWMVRGPLHAFVRVGDRRTGFNLETTLGGRRLPDAKYRELFGGEDPRLLRVLDRHQTIATVLVQTASLLDISHHRDLIREYCVRARRLDPGDGGPWYQLGHLAFVDRNWKQAEELYEKAAHLEPALPQAWFARGIALARQGKEREAAAWFEQGLKIDHRLPGPWIDNGWGALELEEFTLAVHCFNRALRLVPRSVNALRGRCYALLRLEQFQAAADTAAKALAIDGEDVDVRLYRAAALRRLSHYREALRCLEEVLTRDPRREYAWYAKAMNHISLGEHRAARDCLDRAIAIAPEYTEALVTRGGLLFTESDSLAAIADLDRALSHQADNTEALVWKGRCLRQLNRLPAAAKAYVRAIQGDPRRFDAWAELGGVENLLALEVRRVLSDDSSDPPQLLGLPDGNNRPVAAALTFVYWWHLLRSLACHERALALQRENASCWRAKGVVCRVHGFLEEALRCFRKARELDEDAVPLDVIRDAEEKAAARRPGRE